jgi:hypothetical protein
VLLLTSLWDCSSSQDWKAQLKLPPVDARYKTEVRMKFVEAILEIMLEECGCLKILCLHMMMGKRWLFTCTPIVYIKFLVGEKSGSRFSITLPVCGALAKCVC